MHQQLMICDCCKQERRDPKGWISIRHGPFHNRWCITIEPLTPANLMRTEYRRTTEHVCGVDCLAIRIKALAAGLEGPTTKKAAQAKTLPPAGQDAKKVDPPLQIEALKQTT